MGAEYILRWLPAGTHDWRKFVKPSEFAAFLRAAGVEVCELKGMAYVPFRDEWHETSDLDVNYMLYGVKG
jgi:2-polyprenyl-6-hydroxyphenyl methylase/3-demethylubiquinone-9 3-methyltransferase